MRRYVIIGGGIAAAGCIEGIRSMDTGGKIILISGEKRPVYCRPISTFFRAHPLVYRPLICPIQKPAVRWYARRGVSTARRTVRLDSARGSVMIFSAYAGAPFCHPSGLDTVKTNSVSTVDDAGAQR